MGNLWNCDVGFFGGICSMEIVVRKHDPFCHILPITSPLYPVPVLMHFGGYIVLSNYLGYGWIWCVIYLTNSCYYVRYNRSNRHGLRTEPSKTAGICWLLTSLDQACEQKIAGFCRISTRLAPPLRSWFINHSNYRVVPHS